MNWLEKALDQAEEKALVTLSYLGDEFPHSSGGTEWDTSPVTGWEGTYGDWTAGFWPGILWELNRISASGKFLEPALKYTLLLENRLDYGGHDVGFLLHPSAVAAYEATGDEPFSNWALRGADRLVENFNPAIGMITLRKGEPWTAVDTMMNLPLLWWAWRHTGKDTYFRTAFSHAKKSAETFLRPDGSTFHIAKLNKRSGELKWRGTRQGKNDGSCWARGQAWAYAGFLEAERATRRRAFIPTLEKLTAYLAAKLGESFIPAWDFDDDSDRAPTDSSAAAVLAAASTGPPVGGGYTPLPAESIVKELWINHSDTKGAGFIGSGCFHAPKKVSTNASLIFGDYFYLKGLTGLKRRIDGSDESS